MFVYSVMEFISFFIYYVLLGKDSLLDKCQEKKNEEEKERGEKEGESVTKWILK